MPIDQATTACALSEQGGISPAEAFQRRCEPAEVSSSVLPQERKGEPPSWLLHEDDAPREDFAVSPIQEPEAIFRHGFWQKDRRKVWNAFQALHVSRNRLNRFANCGSACIVEYNHEQDRVRLRGNYCHDRWCIPCSQARARFIAGNLVEAITDPSRVRTITLTLKHTNVPLSAQIDRLYACFRRLRDSKAWQVRVNGGAAFLEIVQSVDRSGWHPHLHLIVEGLFWPHDELSRLWYEITGDSSIVHIAAPRSLTDSAHYACKYASKAADHQIYDQPEALAESISATRGRHLCQTFGTWRGLALTPKAQDGVGWTRISSLCKLISEANSGNSQAQRFLSLLRRDFSADLNSS